MGWEAKDRNEEWIARVGVRELDLHVNAAKAATNIKQSEYIL